MKRSVLLIVLFGTILTSCSSIKSSLILQKADVVPFEGISDFNYENPFSLILIKVNIKGKDYQFVFDTGAQTTVISKKLANDITLSSRNSINVRDVHETSQTLEVGLIDTVQIGEISYTGVGVLVNDFENNPVFSCLNIDGILGINVIKLNNWKIDYQNQSFSISGIDNKHDVSETEISIPFVSGPGGIPFVNLFISGQKEQFMLDMGMNSKVISVSSKIQLNNIDNMSVGYSSFGLFGETKIDTTKFSKVNLSDSIKFKKENITVSKSNTNASLIGSGFFQEFSNSITFDFHNRILYIEEKAEKPTSISDYSVSPMLLEDGSIVIGSKELIQSELSIGDTIIGINSVFNNGANSCELLEELWKSRQKRKNITLTILQKGEKLILDLPFKPIIP